MRSDDSESERLKQILELVEREDHHLRGVRGRLFGSMSEEALDGGWVAGVLADPNGIDRVESFGAKFGRMQDTIMDKLLPQFLRAVGENPGTAIDNLNRLEQLGLISNADDWIAMRRVRNRLVHEDIDRPEAMAPALRQARAFTDELHRAFSAVKASSQRRAKDE